MFDLKYLLLISPLLTMTFHTNAQTIAFCTKGLNVFHMGTKLNDAFTADLIEIDTSTIEGMLEYSAASSGADGKAFTYRKLVTKGYRFQWTDSLPTNVYIGYTSEGIIQKILVRCESCDQLKMKDMLIEVYGNPVVEGQGGFNGTTHTSLLFSSGEFDIYFSGLTGAISCYYPQTLEELMKGVKLDGQAP